MADLEGVCGARGPVGVLFISFSWGILRKCWQNVHIIPTQQFFKMSGSAHASGNNINWSIYNKSFQKITQLTGYMLAK